MEIFVTKWYQHDCLLDIMIFSGYYTGLLLIGYFKTTSKLK